METRTILQIILAVTILAVAGTTAFIAYELTREASTTVVKEVIVAGEEPEEPVNPWSTKGDAAIALVKRVHVTPPVFPDPPEEKSRGKRKKKDADEEQVTPLVVPLHLLKRSAHEPLALAVERFFDVEKRPGGNDR